MLVTIHLIIVISTGLVVVWADEQALLWVLGKIPVLHKKRITMLHHVVAAGLALLLVTGGLLYLRAVPAYLSEPIFIVKMLTIAALIGNTWVIATFSHIATSREFSSLSSKEKLPLFVSGGVSFLGWVTAITCGILLA